MLYETLTDQRAFGGDDVADVLSRVLQREPDYDALQGVVPPRVTQVLRLCVRKDPKQRVGDMCDVRLALEGARDIPGAARPTVKVGLTLNLGSDLQKLTAAQQARRRLRVAAEPNPANLCRFAATPPKSAHLE